jgi:hypothetical protein
MKKWISIAVAAWLVGLIMAQGQCCPVAKAAAAAKAGSEAECTAKCLAAADLSDEQAAEVKTLTADCKATGCSVTGAKKMKAGLKEILSEDQLAAMKTSCQKKGCWLEPKKDDVDAAG